MKFDDVKKDMDTGDVETKVSLESNLSPLERVYKLLEVASTLGGEQGLICVMSAGAIAIGILMNLRNDDGKRLYYLADPNSKEADESKKNNMVNLYSMKKKLDGSHGQSPVTMDFTVEEGLHGTVGDAFAIEFPKEYADMGIKALEKEGDKQDLAYAMSNITPILAELGKNGLVEPNRKPSVAGKLNEMKRHMDQDIRVYQTLKADLDKEWKEREKELRQEIKQELQDESG